MESAEFKQRILPLGGKLLRFSMLMLKDKAEAEDAVQEVCLKLWNIRHKLHDIRNIESFAMRITKNWCLDRLKARKPLLVESFSGGLDKAAEDPDPFRQLVLSDRVDAMRAIIDRLPEQQKIILILREIEGYEFEEITGIMDMNLNAVRVNLTRARTRVREELIKLD